MAPGVASGDDSGGFGDAGGHGGSPPAGAGYPGYGPGGAGYPDYPAAGGGYPGYGPAGGGYPDYTATGGGYPDYPAAGGDGGYPPAGPPPGWELPQTQPPERRGRGAVAVILVAALVAAFIGVVIGRSLGRSSSTDLAAESTPPTLPSSSGGFQFPGSFGGSGLGGSGSSGGAGSGLGGSGSSSGTGSASVSAAAAAIAAKVAPGVVDVNTQLSFQNAAAAGTGEVLTANGEILTNNHVIDQATSISVTVPSTGKAYTATVVGFDKTQDVAVLQLKGASGLKTVPLGNSDAVRVGDSVVALGNAEGKGGPPAVVTGTVQSLNQTITASDEDGSDSETLNGMIETDAPIQPGDSGGPLVNSNGQVVGMDTAASSTIRRFGAATSTTSSFAIPINTALSIARQIEAGKSSATVHIGLIGFLGVGVVSTGVGNGAQVTQVSSGTPAAAAGLMPGDVITAVNGTSVASGQDLTTALSSHHPGDKVSVTWITQTGSSQTASVILASGPAD